MAALRRGGFLGAALAAALAPAFVRARGVGGDDADPATSSARAELRVLLGPGQTQAVADGFLFDGNHYRGSFSELADGNIVNRLPLESYLYSVVPLEMSPAWPAAALEAQAVCARTYVLQRSNPRRDYDLVPSEANQVYGGTRSESPAAQTAVDTTAGQVLRYAGAFAQIAYSACCGGHTEASSDAWGGAPFAYLSGVACSYCDSSPHYRWSADLPVERVQSAFGASLGAAQLRAVSIVRRDASGRATQVQLESDLGSVEVGGGAFRSLLGARTIQSLRIYQIGVSADTLHVEGGGLGHGVGLCQWGARGYAQRGAPASAILAYYFPGTAIGSA